MPCPAGWTGDPSAFRCATSLVANYELADGSQGKLDQRGHDENRSRPRVEADPEWRNLRASHGGAAAAGAGQARTRCRRSQLASAKVRTTACLTSQELDQLALAGLPVSDDEVVISLYLSLEKLIK